jgi:hypothetical protein
VLINSSSPAAHLAPKLLELGIEATLTTGAQAADAVVGFVSDALEGRLSHGGDGRLADAVDEAQTKPMAGGKFGWDYSAGDVTRVQVVTLARYGLLVFGVNVRPNQTPLQDDAGGFDADVGGELMSAGF